MVKQRLPFPDFHPEVNSVSKSLYETGHFTDALRKASIKLEEKCKKILQDITGDEMTGVPLMQKLFSYNKQNNKKNEEEDDDDFKECLFPFVNLSLKDSPAKQQSYCNLFSGFAGTIRNTLAHNSDDLDDIEALYGLNIVSYLFYKLDRAIELNDVIIEEVKKEEKIETKSYDPNKKDIENSLLDFLFSIKEIQEINRNKIDESNAKLTIGKIASDILTEKIDEMGEKMFNYYFENQEKINFIILQKIYDKSSN